MLFEFDQCAQKIAGMEEGDGLARDVALRLAGAQQAHAVLSESMRGFPDVVDAEAEVMDAAFRLRSRNLAIGESGRDGSISSILAAPSST